MSPVEPVVIFGVESSFAPETIETLRKLGREIAGSVIAGAAEWEMQGVSPFGTSDVDPGLLAYDAVVPWITPGLKWQKVRQAMDIGFSRFPVLVDPAAGHASSTRMERGVFLNAGVTIGAYAGLGEFVVVNRNASIGHHTVLGAWVSIGPGVAIASRCSIGKGTMIGVGSAIPPGITVGENCLVAAGAVVTRDVPDRSLVTGNPGRVIQSGYPGYKGVLVG